MIRLPRTSRVVLGRMAEFWLYGTGPAALLLLLLAPSILPGRPWAFVLPYLALPAYMLHQVEEHDAGLRRRALGGLFGPEQDTLSLSQLAIINLGLAWVPLIITLWLAVQVDQGWAVLAAWLLLANAALHLGQAVFQGRYNPGLGTALVLFLPLGTAVLATIPASLEQNLSAIAVAVLLHLMVMLVARRPQARAQ